MRAAGIFTSYIFQDKLSTVFRREEMQFGEFTGTERNHELSVSFYAEKSDNCSI